MFAQVAIEQVPNMLFTYRIPEGMTVRVGQRVSVPWQRIYRLGYVISLSETSPYQPTRKPKSAQGELFADSVDDLRVKAITAVDDELPYFSESIIRLLRWLADYYSVGFTLALRSALPAAVRSNGAKDREIYMVTPLNPLPPKLPPLTARQRHLYEEIVRIDGGRLTQVCEELSTTPQTLKKLAAAGYIRCERTVVARSPLKGRFIQSAVMPQLTAGQQRALDEILVADKPCLLFGVTGSGKTEVYMRAIAKTLEEGRDAIVLVPEISLTPQTVSRFAARFGKTVAVLHSALSDGERHDEWHRIRRGEARVVVGPRSAVFAPVQRLGLMIVDEEHDSGYKQDESPRYSARDVAVVRATMEKARCILGSATPSLESWRNAMELGKYCLVRMPERVGGSVLPTVTVLDMQQAAHDGRGVPIFSAPLIDAMRNRLERGEQIILFLNRRGYAPTYQCNHCQTAVMCEKCSAKMTYHVKDDTLRCHLCGAWMRPPTRCPSCGSPDFNRFGFGTQRVETALHAILPTARIIRMDADSTSRRHSHDELLAAFRAKEADILLGTQMIAKGLDFPNVTLVGILAADRSLDMTYDFRAAERTFQLIAQVSGRAGRGTLPGEVYVQTFQPDHPAIRLAAACDYEAFARETLQQRQDEEMPPFKKLACVTFIGSDAGQVASAAEAAAKRFSACRGLMVMPAMPAPLEKKETLWRWQILLRADSAKGIAAACDHVLPKQQRVTDKLRILVDIDAVFLA
ncbi:MAG: primosomal protein N' [Kiritimatiellae bacterium]|nr:primosomal protein N' [Kiritimatiellia bacterium]